MKPKGLALLVIGVLAIIVASMTAGSLVETVDKGTYHIKQAAITGTMTAHMNPGLYGQFLGDYTVWPVSETFYFTHDEEGENSRDQSIEVRFNDGSVCKVSGTLRVLLPRTESNAISLMTQYGYRSYRDLDQKLIMPTVRNALRLTANLMSARESYSEKRSDFNTWARDQIENGLYQTYEEVRKVVDPVSGDTLNKTFKVIKLNDSGSPVHESNPLDGTGITLANFEIKSFQYESRVRDQITTQQEALMAVETAKAQAQEAEQRKITAEAEGQANVTQAQYEEEEKKIKATVQAQRDSAVAVITAGKELQSATLLAKAAEQTKQREILLGQGEAERKKLAMAADGALAQKLDAYVRAQEVWAEAFKSRKVPTTFIASPGSEGSGSDGDVAMFMKLIGVKAAQDLSLNLSTK